jgi:hypothetical protein
MQMEEERRLRTVVQNELDALKARKMELAKGLRS